MIKYCRCPLCRWMGHELVRQALVRMADEGKFTPELATELRIYLSEKGIPMNEANVPAPTVKMTDPCIYIDPTGGEHAALVTHVWPSMGGAGIHGVNLVFLEPTNGAVQYRSSVSPHDMPDPVEGGEFWKPLAAAVPEAVAAPEPEASSERPAAEDPSAEVETESMPPAEEASAERPAGGAGDPPPTGTAGA